MADKPLISIDNRYVDIKECIITSNDGKTIKDIVDIISDVYYYESILQECVRVNVFYVDTGKSVEKDGGLKTLIEGMPLVGTENTSLKITDGNDVELALTLYINKVNPAAQDQNKSLVALDLTSKEAILNYKTVLNTRFDGKISDHIKKILTDPNYLKTKKTLDIEETDNNYNFIGNNRRPFYACVWLAKKAVPKGVQKGKTAGFFFYETSDGFKFKSIDGLLSETELGGGKKKFKKLVYNQTPDGGGTAIPKGYDGKIIEHNTDTPAGDIQSKLEIGTYSTRTILFNPFNCFYEIVNPVASENEKSLKLAGKELPKLNKEFNKEGKDKDFSRTQYMLIDCGSLPTGSGVGKSQEQLNKSKEQNFDPKNILNQSTMRYNQMFSSRTTITITADFSIHAGDLVFIDYPELSDKNNPDWNPEFGGYFVVADLCHYINTSRGGYTKLTLVRDSIGKKGTAYNAL